MQIEIDFEVFKKLTAERQSESDSYNDVLRRLFNMDKQEGNNSTPANSKAAAVEYWISDGVKFPMGMELRAIYKGRTHHATIDKHGVHLGHLIYPSFSKAAAAITKTNVNGWTFWECKLSTSKRWQKLGTYRHLQRLDGIFD